MVVLMKVGLEAGTMAVAWAAVMLRGDPRKASGAQV